MEIEVRVKGITEDPLTRCPMVALKSVRDPRYLIIWIGPAEANAIMLKVEDVATARPMTHDLLANIFTGLDTKLKKIVITHLLDDTYYAYLVCEKEGGEFRFDSRPSDGLALAYRVDCPVFVEDELFGLFDDTLAQRGDTLLQDWIRDLESEPDKE